MNAPQRGKRLPDPVFLFASFALELGITLEELRDMRVAQVIRALQAYRARFEASPLLGDVVIAEITQPDEHERVTVVP